MPLVAYLKRDSKSMYAVNINDFHVCVLLFFLDVQLPEAGFSRDGIFFFFIRQSVIVFQEIELKKKRKKGRKREKERRRSIHFLN